MNNSSLNSFRGNITFFNRYIGVWTNGIQLTDPVAILAEMQNLHRIWNIGPQTVSSFLKSSYFSALSQRLNEFTC